MANGKRQIQVENFSNRKRAAKNSPKQQLLQTKVT